MTFPSRLYLSGPMTGLPQFNYPAFTEAAVRLRLQGYVVVSPVKVSGPPGREWHEYLRADIKALVDCDGIALMPGWETSAGAHLELHIAHRLGMSVHFVEDLLRDA